LDFHNVPTGKAGLEIGQKGGFEKFSIKRHGNYSFKHQGNDMIIE